ncbi:viperin family antiviral radical SAM protein [Streptomyces sp. NPDC051554]|uniref:viperin family antiviral radical SAM protein n=1 Tax=Streptomyces sp. NPDC051554 TaxID=3365656 RepID=UPI00379D9721
MDEGFGELPAIESVNFHLWQPCNMRCGFCFARFKDVRTQVLPAGHLTASEALQVVALLAEAGFRKITFAGGEPFLCPWLSDLIEAAHRLGMVTSVVTNGSLVKVDDSLASILDWLVVSIDSLSSRVLTDLGRTTAGRPLSEDDYRVLCESIHRTGIRLKINTVVTRVNWHENLAPFVIAMSPRRWKILQMLPIEGQNGGSGNALAVSDGEFQQFVERHIWVSRYGIKVVPENNDAMTGSYAMLDPAARFFDNVRGRYTYSDSILECGVATALGQVQLDRCKYLSRGGHYDWGNSSLPVIAQEAG